MTEEELKASFERLHQGQIAINENVKSIMKEVAQITKKVKIALDNDQYQEDDLKEIKDLLTKISARIS